MSYANFDGLVLYPVLNPRSRLVDLSVQRDDRRSPDLMLHAGDDFLADWQRYLRRHPEYRKRADEVAHAMGPLTAIANRDAFESEEGSWSGAVSDDYVRYLRFVTEFALAVPACKDLKPAKVTGSVRPNGLIAQIRLIG